MGSTPDTTRRHVDLAGIGLGVCNEIRNGPGRQDWIDHHDQGLASQACDRDDVTDEIEIELVIERDVDGIRDIYIKKRIPVWGRTHDHFAADVAASAWTVLDDERLAEPLLQPLSYQASKGVACATSRKTYHQTHRPRRIGLRPRETRHCRERGSAHSQMQKLTAGKFHFEPPFTSFN